jgi:PTH2 family peptidyl-tRNA hydrolase
MAFKQVILVRQDLKLPKGKLAAQVAHASVGALVKSHKDDVRKWRISGEKKVVLKVSGKEDLFRLKEEAEDAGLIAAVVTDAGRTVLEPGTVTCLGIGPDREEKIDSITGKLKML